MGAPPPLGMGILCPLARAHRLHTQLLSKNPKTNAEPCRAAPPRQVPLSSQHPGNAKRVCEEKSDKVVSAGLGTVVQKGCRPPRLIEQGDTLATGKAGQKGPAPRHPGLAQRALTAAAAAASLPPLAVGTRRAQPAVRHAHLIC